MRKFFFLLVLFSISKICTSQDIITQELSNFNSLYANSEVEILLVPSNRNYMEIKIIRGEKENFITEINGSQLSIEWYTGNWFTSWFMENDNKAEVTLYFKKINEISVDSDAKIQSNEPILNDNFDLFATDGGRLQLIMGCDQLKVNAESGGSVTLKGEANAIQVEVSSGGEFWGAEFNTNESNVVASSGSSAVVYSKDKINLQAGSGATIKYRGNPPKKIIDQSLWGGGTIKQM